MIPGPITASYFRGFSLTLEIPLLTGIPDPYELPLNPEVKLHRDREPPEQNTEKIIAALGELGYLPYEFAITGSASTPEEEALVEERLKNLGCV